MRAVRSHQHRCLQHGFAGVDPHAALQPGQAGQSRPPERTTTATAVLATAERTQEVTALGALTWFLVGRRRDTTVYRQAGG